MKKGKKAVIIRRRRNGKGNGMPEEDAREDGMREKVRLLQTALWVGVILLQMAVVGNMEVHAQGTDDANLHVPGSRHATAQKSLAGTWGIPEFMPSIRRRNFYGNKKRTQKKENLSVFLCFRSWYSSFLFLGCKRSKEKAFLNLILYIQNVFLKH